MHELTKRYYDDNAAAIFQALGRHYNAHLVSASSDLDTCVAEDLAYIVKTAGLSPVQAILECGCGNGFVAGRLMQMLPGIGYTGCDLSSSQVQLARQLNPGARIRELSYEDLDFPAACFDRVLFLETLGYCSAVDVMLEHLFRVLKPGGKVFVKNPGQKIVDRAEFEAQSAVLQPVASEYGFEPGSLGMIPDIDGMIAAFRRHGFALELQAYPYTNEYFYNAAFYSDPRICTPIRMPDKITAMYDFRGFDPQRSLSELGKRHPRYVAYHRDLSEGRFQLGRNQLFGCVVLVFGKSEGGEPPRP